MNALTSLENAEYYNSKLIGVSGVESGNMAQVLDGFAGSGFLTVSLAQEQLTVAGGALPPPADISAPLSSPEAAKAMIEGYLAQWDGERTHYAGGLLIAGIEDPEVVRQLRMARGFMIFVEAENPHASTMDPKFKAIRAMASVVIAHVQSPDHTDDIQTVITSMTNTPLIPPFEPMV